MVCSIYIISGETYTKIKSMDKVSKQNGTFLKTHPLILVFFCWTEVKLQFILGIASNESTETLTNIDDTLLDTSERLKENAV